LILQHSFVNHNSCAGYDIAIYITVFTIAHKTISNQVTARKVISIVMFQIACIYKAGLLVHIDPKTRQDTE